MPTQIDLKRLRYIVEVARAQAITTAAETLGLTQPALTRSIGEVETLLDTRLFHRLPRGMQLTETGERFVTQAKQILSQVDDLLADVIESAENVTGRLRLGVTPTGWLAYARPALGKLAVDYPGIRIEIINGTAQDLCPRLLHGEINAIVSSSKYLERWRDVEVTPLRSLDFGCLVRKDHPVTQITDPLETDILAYPVILPASVDPTYSTIAQRYMEHNLPPLQPHYVTDDWELIQTLLKSSDAYHPHLYPGTSSADEGLLILKDLVTVPEHRLSLALSKLYPKSQATRLFEALMVASYT